LLEAGYVTGRAPQGGRPLPEAELHEIGAGAAEIQRMLIRFELFNETE
jgi:hypothetical protein